MGYLIIGDLYNRIFRMPLSHPELTVDYETWNRIFASLPQDYKVPDDEVLSALTRPPHSP